VVVREGIFAQQAVVDDIRSKISFEVAQRLKESHREPTLHLYRAAQAIVALPAGELSKPHTWRSLDGVQQTFIVPGVRTEHDLVLRERIL
jgi:hypothetical protein